MPDEPRRYTFSLRDIFVATAVIGLLLALLLPSVQSSRSSRRSLCSYNMRNVGLAMQSFEARNSRFPGYANTVGGGTTSYIVPILPYLERMDLYHVWSDPNSSLTEASVFEASVFIDMLCCPSNPRASRTLPWLSNVVNSGEASSENSADGICFDQTKSHAPTVSLVDIANHDGLSNTLLLSENLQAETWTVSSVASARLCTTMVWHKNWEIDSSWRINSPCPVEPISSLNFARPSSKHVGGVNVIFCDGHQRFIAEDIDYNVYRQLMTSNGAKSNDPINKSLKEADF